MRNLKEIGKRIKVARLLTNLTRKEFCEKYNINPHTLLSLETGRLSPSEKKIKELIAAFINESVVCTANWITEGKGSLPHTIQDLNNSRDGPTENDESDEGISILKEIALFSSASQNAVVTVINDDAMLPLYNIGDYVGGKFIPKEKVKDLSGENCIIEIKKDKIIVRHLLIENERIILSAINPKCKLSAPVLSVQKINKAAKIIWHRSQG